MPQGNSWRLSDMPLSGSGETSKMPWHGSNEKFAMMPPEAFLALLRSAE
jgi:hypothetical protein